jgi:hypothetical protein
MEKMLSSSMRFVIFLTICDKVCVICSRFDKLSILSFLSEKGAISLNSAILTRGDSITFTSDEQCVHSNFRKTILANVKFSGQLKIIISKT